MNIIFDSNVWIAFLNKKDSLHNQAVEIFSQNTDLVIVPEYIALEVSSVLQIRATQKIANNFLNKLFVSSKTKILFSNQELFINTNKLFQSQTNEGLSFVDCALFALSKQYKIITLDNSLNKILKNSKF